MYDLIFARVLSSSRMVVQIDQDYRCQGTFYHLNPQSYLRIIWIILSDHILISKKIGIPQMIFILGNLLLRL